MSLEIITRYEKKKPTQYSFDGGKTWLTKAEFKKQVHAKKKAAQ